MGYQIEHCFPSFFKRKGNLLSRPSYLAWLLLWLFCAIYIGKYLGERPYSHHYGCFALVRVLFWRRSLDGRGGGTCAVRAEHVCRLKSTLKNLVSFSAGRNVQVSGNTGEPLGRLFLHSRP